MDEKFRTVKVPKDTVIKIAGIPFVLAEDALVRGTPGNIAMIFFETKKEKLENADE